jgi:hypothetical protein
MEGNTQAVTDAELKAKIDSLKDKIKSWADSHDLWYDAGFLDPIEHFGERPDESPCVLALWYEGPLFNIFRHYSDADLLNEFDELIEGTEFEYDIEDHITMTFMARDEKLAEEYRKYFDFRWVCQRIGPEFAEIYTELFEHFARHPDNLEKLWWRDFERLLETVFGNQGYRTELGSGSNDEGADIRLYRTGGEGEALTVVQAKRFKKHLAIKLDWVAALLGVVLDQKAEHGILVTTSRYLPSARRFAERHPGRISLATSEDVSKWCAEIATRLKGYSPDEIDREALHALKEGVTSGSLVGRIVHISCGVNIVANEFCLIVKETPKAVLLKRLPQKIVQSDYYRQTGYEEPDTSSDSEPLRHGPQYVRAEKIEVGGELRFNGGHRQYYGLWDGKPKWFDLAD